MHELNGLVYYFLYLGHPLFVRIRPKSQLLSTPSLRFFSFQSFERILLDFALPPSLSLFLFRPQCYRTKNAARSLHIQVFYVFLGSLIYSHISFERLIVNCAQDRKRWNIWLFKSFFRGNKNWVSYVRKDWDKKWKRYKNEKRESVREQCTSVQQFSRLLGTLYQ